MIDIKLLHNAIIVFSKVLWYPKAFLINNQIISFQQKFKFKTANNCNLYFLKVSKLI